MQQDESRQIYDAFIFVRRVGDEISALYREIDDELRRVCKDVDEKYTLEYDTDEQKPAYRSDYWVCEAWAPSFALSIKGKKSILGYLYYLFDLSYTGGPAEQIKEAVVGVGYVGERALREHPQKMKIDTFYPWQPTVPDSNKRHWELADDRKIWFWNGGVKDFSDVNNACWIYFVPLATIRDHKDVSDVLVTPPLELLRKKTASLDQMTQALRFAKGQFVLDPSI